jgi:hypothetical protein
MVSVGRVAATTCWGRHRPQPKIFRGKLDSTEALIIFCFFLGPSGMPAQKSGQYSPWRLWASHSYHLDRASLPTPEGLTGQDTSAGQDASAAGFAGLPYNCESDEEPTAEDGTKDTVDAANQPLPPSKTKH